MAARSYDRKEFRTTPKFLATIDFGTTHCSVAYLLRPDLASPSRIDPTVLKLDNAGNRRVPSCILFDSNGNMIAFGQEARQRFTALKRDQRPGHHYFEYVKKHLQHEENIDRNQKITALNGKQFYLVDVVAHILHHLKWRLLTEVRDFGYKKLKASDIDWVITVPAIWKSKGKKMMREAGYMAGLCSGSEPPPIRDATEIRNQPMDEKSPEKLSLALEPESAAIHCRHKATEAGKGEEYLVKAKSYIVINIGGGTVDIASHSIGGGRIEELATPVGNFYGGTTVNDKFSEFLQDFVDDKGFKRYIESGTLENQTQHKADLSRLLYGNSGFESQKLRFGSGDGGDTYFLEFPHSFWKLYEDSLVSKGKALNSGGDMSVQVEEDSGVMRISASKMAQFFQPAIDEITNLIASHLQENSIACLLDTIYWVGGFGGCKYLRNQLEMVINRSFRHRKYHFPVPPEPHLAVIRGATAFRCHPSIVRKRKADATYGTGDFDAVLNCPKTKESDENHAFHAFVKRGEDIDTSKVFVMKFTVRKKDQKSATFPLYSTLRTDVKYTTEDKVHKLGEVTVQLGGYGPKREIELLFDITHTEIHVRARDTTSHNEQKVVVDFLTSRNEEVHTPTPQDVQVPDQPAKSPTPPSHMKAPHKAVTPQPQSPPSSHTPSTATSAGKKTGATQQKSKPVSSTQQKSKPVSSPPPPQPPSTSTDTLAENDLLDITDYLLNMEKNHIYHLGLVIGLSQTKVKGMMKSDTFLDDVIAAWLRKEDSVKEKGEPSWTVLIRSLKHRRVSQTGIADTIAKDKELPQ